VADGTVMWKVTWQDDMAAEVADPMLTWQVTVQLVGVAQWFVVMWPIHGLPRGTIELVIRSK